MILRTLLVGLLLLSGCRKVPEPEAPVGDAVSVLEMARARPVSERMQARFNIRIQSPALGLSGSTGGGVVLDRPARTRIDIFGPLGTMVYSVTSSGGALAVTMAREERHLLGANAEEAIREATAGVAGLDDLLAVLQGDLPFDQAEPASLDLLTTGEVRVLLVGPQGTQVEARLDPVTATPTLLIARAADGRTALEARYGDFVEVDGELLPDRLLLHIPEVQLTLDLNYRGWKLLDAPPAPEVFSVAPPEGIRSEPLEDVLLELIAAPRGLEAGAPAQEGDPAP